MAQTDSATLTWEIEKFANLANVNVSSHIKTRHDTFWLRFHPKNNLKDMNNHIVIYLFRLPPHATNLKVLWTISLINDKGKDCYTKVLDAYFTNVVSNNFSIAGTLYHLHRDTILEPSSGLLSGGKLTVKCTVTILDDQSRVNLATMSIEDKMITLAQKKMFENYQSLLESSKFSDVVFVIGKRHFKLHKNILSTQSPVFAAMFNADLEEAKRNRVDIIDVDVEVFEAMVSFIYTGNVDAVNQYAMGLLVAADKYQLDSLKDICARSLASNLNIESVANVLLMADMHSQVDLKSKCVQFINANALKVMATEGWKQLVKNAKPFELLHELYLDIVTRAQK